MKILIVHQNFPGQFPHIAEALVRRGDTVAAIGGPTAKGRPGVDLRRWRATRGSTPGLYPPAVRAEADLIRAEAALGAAEGLAADGFAPDVIVGHPGWGETLHLKRLWPDARLILFAEYWYRSVGGDSDFDAEFGRPDAAERLRIEGKNATQALAYVEAERLIAPTAHQAATFPASLRARMAVIHEGIDLARARRRPEATLRLAGGRVLDASVPIVTFVSRTLEPMRGFHIFLRALPAFLDAVPDGQAVVIGEDRPAGYGGASPGGKGWKAAMLAEPGERLDLSRVHFLGRVPHETMIDALSIGAAHFYYTYPFVLSWSLVEAMACGCLVLASDTGPVRDAITDGVDGRLLPFFDVPALSAAMIAAAERPDDYRVVRQAARARALAGFDQTAGTKAWLAEIGAAVAHR